jgi:hypothetical protein
MFAEETGCWVTIEEQEDTNKYFVEDCHSGIPKRDSHSYLEQSQMNPLIVSSSRRHDAYRR